MAETKNDLPRNSNGASPAQNAKGEPANIPAATGFDASGAPEQTAGIDASHPAVDDNPRANTTVDQNKIDFNDPTITGAEAVARNLEEQGLKVNRDGADVERRPGSAVSKPQA